MEQQATETSTAGKVTGKIRKVGNSFFFKKGKIWPWWNINRKRLLSKLLEIIFPDLTHCTQSYLPDFAQGSAEAADCWQLCHLVSWAVQLPQNCSHPPGQTASAPFRKTSSFKPCGDMMFCKEATSFKRGPRKEKEKPMVDLLFFFHVDKYSDYLSSVQI